MVVCTSAGTRALSPRIRRWCMWMVKSGESLLTVTGWTLGHHYLSKSIWSLMKILPSADSFSINTCILFVKTTTHFGELWWVVEPVLPSSRDEVHGVVCTSAGCTGILASVSG
jgi:hypothetical protein